MLFLRYFLNVGLNSNSSIDVMEVNICKLVILTGSEITSQGTVTWKKSRCVWKPDTQIQTSLTHDMGSDIRDHDRDTHITVF